MYNLELALCIHSASTFVESINHGLCSTLVFTIEKYLHVMQIDWGSSHPCCSVIKGIIFFLEKSLNDIEVFKPKNKK